jgi:hypothetical protein
MPSRATIRNDFVEVRRNRHRSKHSDVRPSCISERNAARERTGCSEQQAHSLSYDFSPAPLVKRKLQHRSVRYQVRPSGPLPQNVRSLQVAPSELRVRVDLPSSSIHLGQEMRASFFRHTGSHQRTEEDCRE